MNDFVLNIDGYEGPIELLLDLATKQKVDLKHISILELADQYSNYVKNDLIKYRYIFPPGPGNVVMSQSIGAWLGDSTLNFIVSEIPEYQFLAAIDKKRLQKNYAKKDYVFFLEMYLRKSNHFFSRDLIWIKYLL